MGNYSILRIPRKNSVIKESNILFSKALISKDYALAGKSVFYCVLKLNGVNLILNALHSANSFIERKRLRKGYE